MINKVLFLFMSSLIAPSTYAMSAEHQPPAGGSIGLNTNKLEIVDNAVSCFWDHIDLEEGQELKCFNSGSVYNLYAGAIDGEKISQPNGWTIIVSSIDGKKVSDKTNAKLDLKMDKYRKTSIERTGLQTWDEYKNNSRNPFASSDEQEGDSKSIIMISAIASKGVVTTIGTPTLYVSKHAFKLQARSSAIYTRTIVNKVIGLDDGAYDTFSTHLNQNQIWTMNIPEYIYTASAFNAGVYRTEAKTHVKGGSEDYENNDVGSATVR
jgi:hypothetical protein